MSNGHCGRITRNFQLHQDIRPSFEMVFWCGTNTKFHHFKWSFPHKNSETYLVGGFNPSEKYESQLGWWHSQYMGNHKIPWFQSTHQIQIPAPKLSSFLATPLPGDWCNWWKTDNFTSERRRISASQCSNAWPWGETRLRVPGNNGIQWLLYAIIACWCILCHMIIVIYSVYTQNHLICNDVSHLCPVFPVIWWPEPTQGLFFFLIFFFNLGLVPHGRTETTDIQPNEGLVTRPTHVLVQIKGWFQSSSGSTPLNISQGFSHSLGKGWIRKQWPFDVSVSRKVPELGSRSNEANRHKTGLA